MLYFWFIFDFSRGQNDATGLWGSSLRQDWSLPSLSQPPSPPLLILLQLPKRVGLQVCITELSELVRMTSDSIHGIFHVVHRYSSAGIFLDKECFLECSKLWLCWSQIKIEIKWWVWKEVGPLKHKGYVPGFCIPLGEIKHDLSGKDSTVH